MRWRSLAYLAACGLSLALSLLILFPAPTLLLWEISVGVTELSAWLLLGAAVLFLFGCRAAFPGRLGAWAALLACVVFSLPLFQAARIAKGLPALLERGLGPLPEAARQRLPVPFSLRTIFFAGRAPRVPVREIHYVERNGTALHLDFYRASGIVPAPCVVVVHGGGWNTGTSREIVRFDDFLAERGMAVASVEYRLAPGAVWPAQRDDVLAAIAYLKAHAAELGLDAQRFVLFGRSAGGQIAEAVAYEAGDPAIRGCIAFYAPADLNFAFRYANPKDVLNSYKLLIDYLGGTPAQVPQNYDSASPIRYVTPRTPPTLLMHGRHDPLVWFLQSERLAARLNEQGVPHAFVALPWATHAFDLDGCTPGGQLAAYATCYFLAATVNR